MAFDLVQYFAEQIKIQKPQLFSKFSAQEKQAYIEEVNVLTLGQLISFWKQDHSKVYKEIYSSDPLYIQGVARHLTTSAHNKSSLKPAELEASISEILTLQLTELKQLDETGSFGQTGLTELLTGQIEHLSGQAEDWVWSTNQLAELLGSKPVEQHEISLDATLQEFSQLVHHTPKQDEIVVEQAPVPNWAYIVAPLVALYILVFLYCAYSQLVS